MDQPYRVISADSHLELPPERWTAWAPAPYRDRAPHTVKLSNGADAVVVEGASPLPAGLNVQGGLTYEQFDPVGVSYAGAPGTGDGAQRVRELDQDGVDAEVLFPGQAGPQFSRTIRDDAVYRAMIRAYNDWLAQEYCAVAPDRLLGMGCMPTTSIDDALAELEYCRKLGFKGIVLNAFPNGGSYPTAEDDRFWAAAIEMAMPVTVHVSTDFGRGGASGPLFKYSPSTVAGLPGPDPLRTLSSYALRGGVNAVQLVVAGVFDRFPTLHIYFAENEAGWIPMFLQELDNRYARTKHWMERLYGIPQLERLPSEYVREHCSWGFLRDPFGVQVRHHIGLHRLLWGGDFPHYNSDWPNSQRIRDENFVGVPPDERYWMEVGNALEFFHLEQSG